MIPTKQTCAWRALTNSAKNMATCREKTPLVRKCADAANEQPGQPKRETVKTSSSCWLQPTHLPTRGCLDFGLESAVWGKTALGTARASWKQAQSVSQDSVLDLNKSQAGLKPEDPNQIQTFLECRWALSI
jgi:hypothetical protein